MKPYYPIFLAILFISMQPFVFSAYSGVGEIQGRVTDQEGKPLAYVNISFERNGETMGGTSSDHNGNYNATLPSGTYTVLASAINFRTTKFTDVKISDDAIEFLTIVMEWTATVLPPIVFVAPEPIISNYGLDPPVKFDKEKLKTFPGTSINDVLSTVGGAYQKDSKSAVQFMGTREYASATFIDDFRVNINIDLPIEALEEVKVTLTGIPAKYGDFTGAMVQINTVSF